MSTDTQDTSIGHQTAVIREFARSHGYQIVRSYADEGISGVEIDRRAGLQQLLKDVVLSEGKFAAILVYDVSRWGRFQNPDEGAHYEFICAEAGTPVIYCAEPFGSDNSITSVLLKGVKRVMAAEYSRELSARVSRAHAELAAQGLFQGGPPGYALRRQVIHADGRPGRVLEAGERKGQGNGRTILVPGPPDEVATVRRIYALHLKKKLGAPTIARLLNAEGNSPERGRMWTQLRVQRVLRDERYAGTYVIRKTCRVMGSAWAARDPSEWIRAAGAITPLVSRRDFEAGCRQRARQARRFTNEQIAEGLYAAWRRNGRLTARIINADPALPSTRVIALRFGSVAEAYERIGYGPGRQQALNASRLRSHIRRRRPRHRLVGLGPEEVIVCLRRVLATEGRLTRDIINEALGPKAFHAAALLFGGVRRMFALAGYAPTRQQNLRLDRSTVETMSREEAEALRRAVLRELMPPAVPISQRTP